jgi:hypothetical protein
MIDSYFLLRESKTKFKFDKLLNIEGKRPLQEVLGILQFEIKGVL